MKKRIISVLLMLVMATSIVLSGCSAKDSKKDTTQMTEEERDAYILKTMMGEKSKVLTEEQLLKDGYIIEEDTFNNTDDMIMLLSNDRYSLYVNFNDSDFAVYDSTSDLTYHSSSLRTSEAGSSDILKLSAYDNTNKSYVFSTSENCVKDPKAFKVIQLDADTIRIVYTIGNDSDKELVPPVLSEDTYFKIIDKIQKKAEAEKDEKVKDELLYKIDDLHNLYKKLDPKNLSLEDKEKLQDKYPMITVKTMYVVRNLTEKQKLLVREAMIAADFTVSDLKKELNDVEYAGESRAVLFTVPLDLTLTDKGLKVNVDTSLILCPEDQKLNTISVLPYFGAFKPSSGKESGYMIVPDGSGTVISAVGNYSTFSYVGRVYGTDETFVPEWEASKTENPLGGFFVFDRASNGGYIATIDAGASMSFINALPMGSSSREETGVTCAFYDIVYRERDFSNYEVEVEASSDDSSASEDGEVEYETKGTGSGVVMSKDMPKTVYEINYMFNDFADSGESPSYAWYANKYRDHLIEAKKLPEKKLPTEGKTPFYLELLGAINKTESKAGIPVNTEKTLTSYSEADTIVKEIYEKGIPGNALKLRYSYWSNGGYENFAYSKLDLLDEMGSKSELMTLRNTLSENGSKFFPSADFMYVHKDVSGDGISYSADAARNLSFSIARTNKRFEATGKLSESTVTEKTLLSPEIINELSSSFKKSYEKTFGEDMKTISLVGMGDKLNSSYKSDVSFTRDLAMQEHIKAFENYAGYDIMIDRGNDYSWKYVSDIIDLPMGSSEYLSSEGSIPFVQMILHGYVNYSGAAFNVESDYTTSALRAIETGSGIYFKWMAADNSIFKYTPFTDFYSLNYKDTFDEAIKAYKAVSEFCDLVQGQLMIDHSEPEAYIENPYIGDVYKEDGGSKIPLTATKNVYMTTFENGVQVVVNYNGYNVELREDRTLIEANSYIYRMDEGSEWITPQNFNIEKGGNN